MALGSVMGDLRVDRFGVKDLEEEQDDQTADSSGADMEHKDGSAQQRMGLHLHWHTVRRMDWGLHAHCAPVARWWDRARHTDHLSLHLPSWPARLREAVAGTGEAALAQRDY